MTIDSSVTASSMSPVEAAARVVSEWWRPEVTVRQWWAALMEAGLAHPTWPPGLGGRGLRVADRAATTFLAEKAVIAAPTGGVAAMLVAPTMLEHASQAQVERFLPAIARGEESWCQLFSEPGAGSDLASASCRATPSGDGWLVSGQKVWNSAADVARRGLLLARTDGGADRHAGLTMFALDMDQPGVTVRPLRQMDGGTSFCEVFLDGVRVGPDEVIGGLGNGWTVARTTLKHERQSAGSNRAGGLVVPSGERAGYLDRPVGEVAAELAARRPGRINGYAVSARVLIDLARSRGRAHDPLVREALARYYGQTRINRMNGQRFAQAGSSHPGCEGPILKLGTVDTCLASASLVYTILGPDGMLAGDRAPMEGALVRSALGSPGSRLGGGTDEIQRNVLAERALGLPKDPTGT